MAIPHAIVDRTAVEQQLERVLRSRVFERAQRSQRFLRYLVELALAQPPVVAKEFTIAMDVFDRDASYDSAVDATVRVEASRLRSRLREYYDEEGRDDPWLIEVPKGGYAVVLTERTAKEATGPVSPPAMVAGGEPSAQEGRRFGVSARQIGGAAYLLAACVVIVGVAGLLSWRREGTPKPAGMAPPRISLAILPIANRTGDPQLNYVTDGLTDDLIRQLSQLPALRLMARTTMFRYRDRSGDAAAIARALHVDAVMTGELRRGPEHLVMTIEASRVGDGSVVLDHEYIADLHDLRTVQAEIQQDLIARLHVESSALDPGRTLPSVTSSPQAYQDFLEGDVLSRSGAPADLHQALPYFERAVALDPHFDLAWAALASDHLLLGLYFEPPRRQMPLAREYAERALRINPSLGEAHGSLGLIHLVYDWNLPAAEAEMNTAGAETAAIGTLACTAHLMERSGRPQRAEEMLEGMLTYDPQSAALISELGCVDFYRGHYEAAVRHYRDALAADPRTPVPYWGMGKTLNAEGRYTEAIGVLRSFKQKNGFEPPLLTAERGYALGASGQREQALKVIRSLGDEGQRLFVDPYLIAVVYASMNDRRMTFLWLNKALQARSSFAISLLSDPKWQTWRSDPQFAALVEQMLHGRAG